jgi:valyl-tRNA synthetase
VAMSSQDVRYDESRIEGFRRFCNKLWNAAKPILTSIGDGELAPLPDPDDLVLLEDRWVLSRLAVARDTITRGVDEFAFQDSINAGYGFAWNEFCDWWLEAAKARLKANDPVAQAIGLYCLDNTMRLLHPFMPFVTEELWSRLPGTHGFVMQADWPDDVLRYIDGQAEIDFESLMATVYEIRSYRKTVSGAPAKGGAVKLTESLGADWERALALIADVVVTDHLPPGKELGLAAGSIVFPAITGADPAVTRKRIDALQNDFDRAEAKLANPAFLEKAPTEEVEKQRARAEELSAEIERLRALL